MDIKYGCAYYGAMDEFSHSLSLEYPAGRAGPGMLRQEQEIITMRVSVEVRRGTIPGRSLACLSSPRCLRPKHSLGLQARSSHLLRKHKQPLCATQSQNSVCFGCNILSIDPNWILTQRVFF